MRKEIHTRNVATQVWLHQNGDWEIETRLLDTKAYDTRVGLGRELPAGEALHDMRIALRVDSEQRISEISVEMPATPFDLCPGVIHGFESLRGESMGSGWNQLLSQRFAGAGGCRHLVDLLRGAATVLFQAMSYQGDFSREQLPKWSDSCFAFQKNGAVMNALKDRFADQAQDPPASLDNSSTP